MTYQTISDTQKVDYLFKKLGWGVAKTDFNGVGGKDAYQEAIASPLMLRGDIIWSQSDTIPASIPSSSTATVTVYKDAAGGQPTVQCTEDSDDTLNVTWLTGLKDWIPVEFGSSYLVQVYIAPTGSSNPQTSGVKIFAGGSGHNDQWFFDYQAGVLNFAGSSLPTDVYGNLIDFTGKSVFVSGARYTGPKGVTRFDSADGINIGNINIKGNTITGNTGVTFGGNITVPDIIITDNIFYANGASALAPRYGNTDVAVYLTTATGNISAYNLTASGKIYANAVTSLSGNLTLTPQNNSITVINSSSALQLPSGTISARPTGIPGYLRFNSDTNSIEFFDGATWVSAINSITQQTIQGDGATKSFPLDQLTTSVGVLVSINGTVQEPDVAYTVSGTQIVFAEAPQTTDFVDVRFLVTASASIIDTEIVTSGAITVGTSTTLLDSWDKAEYRSAKYNISSSTGTQSQTSDVWVTHNGTTSFTSNTIFKTGADTVNFSTTIVGGNVLLQAISTTTGNQVRMQRTYFKI